MLHQPKGKSDEEAQCETEELAEHERELTIPN